MRARFIPPLLKMRQRNNAEDKLLVKKIIEIESGHRQHNRKLITEIAELHTTLKELDRDGGDHCLDYFDAPEKAHDQRISKNLLNDIVGSKLVKEHSEKPSDQGYLFVNNGIVQASIENHPMRNVRSQLIPCMFGSGVKNMTCQHFPCARPKGYNSIGFQITKRQYPSGLTCPGASDQCDIAPNGETQPNEVLQGSTITSTLELAKTTGEAERLPRFATRAKVLALKHILEERKRKLAETKPRSWETNYGEPVPLRRLQNPLRPVPTESGD